MRWSIRYQLLIPLLALLLGIVAVSTWTAVTLTERAVRRQIEAQARDVAATFSHRTFPITIQVLEQVKGLSGADFVYVAADGRRLATRTARDSELPKVETLATDARLLTLGPPTTVAGENFLIGGVRLKQLGESDASIYILYPEDRWQAALAEAIRPAFWLGASAAVVAFGLAIYIAQRLTRRIRALERRTRLIAAGDFSPMPLGAGDDELRDLAKSVNEMAAQLAQLQESMKRGERLRLLGQVSGGLAHQMRNGVTGARLAVQLHARDCAATADGEALNVALRQLRLLEDRLKSFLDIGRGEGFRKEPCSLSHLVNEALELLGPQCEHAHTQLNWERPEEEFRILGDAGQLGHLILNLLRNAVEAAGPGGRVEVRLAAGGSGPVLEVCDSGPGPAPEVAGRLFEPFVTGKPDGVGLGLAVAKQVAAAHGGRITWRRDLQQTCFRAEFPIS